MGYYVLHGQMLSHFSMASQTTPRTNRMLYPDPPGGSAWWTLFKVLFVGRQVFGASIKQAMVFPLEKRSGHLDMGGRHLSLPGQTFTLIFL